MWPGKGDVTNRRLALKDCPVERKDRDRRRRRPHNSHGNIADQVRPFGPVRGIDTAGPKDAAANRRPPHPPTPTPRDEPAVRQPDAEEQLHGLPWPYHRVVGPRWDEIAKKYDGRADATWSARSARAARACGADPDAAADGRAGRGLSPLRACSPAPRSNCGRTMCQGAIHANATRHPQAQRHWPAYWQRPACFPSTPWPPGTGRPSTPRPCRTLSRHPAASAGDSKDVAITSPDIAENGAVVPIAVTSALPKTEAIYILVEKNPFPLTATFASATARIPTWRRAPRWASLRGLRRRLRADGKLYATKETKVTLGGCGG